MPIQTATRVSLVLRNLDRVVWPYVAYCFIWSTIGTVKLWWSGVLLCVSKLWERKGKWMNWSRTIPLKCLLLQMQNPKVVSRMIGVMWDLVLRRTLWGIQPSLVRPLQFRSIWRREVNGFFPDYYVYPWSLPGSEQSCRKGVSLDHMRNWSCRLWSYSFGDHVFLGHMYKNRQKRGLIFTRQPNFKAVELKWRLTELFWTTS